MRYLIQFKSLTAITPSPKLEMYAELSIQCAKHRLITSAYQHGFSDVPREF